MHQPDKWQKYYNLTSTQVNNRPLTKLRIPKQHKSLNQSFDRYTGLSTSKSCSTDILCSWQSGSFSPQNFTNLSTCAITTSTPIQEPLIPQQLELNLRVKDRKTTSTKIYHYQLVRQHQPHVTAKSRCTKDIDNFKHGLLIEWISQTIALYLSGT